MKLFLPPPKSFEDGRLRMDRTIKEERKSSFYPAFTTPAHDVYPLRALGQAGKYTREVKTA